MFSVAGRASSNSPKLCVDQDSRSSSGLCFNNCDAESLEMKYLLVLILFVLPIGFVNDRTRQTQMSYLALPQEKHLRNLKQLTFGGENAEAYFSSDGKKLIFQSTPDGHDCDQIYTMNIDGSDVKLVSTGEGRTTCSYFFPGDKRILYSSTHLGGKQCPPRPDFSQGYVWAVYDTFDIFTANPDGSNVKQLTDITGYDAETTINRRGKLVFTSKRSGDRSEER